MRHASYNSEFFDPNELDSNVFGAAGPGPISSFDDSNTKISFLSFVYPFERFVLSGYYQNSGELRANSSITSVDAFFSDIYVAETSIDAEQESFGLSGAFRISDMFSIGASIKHSSLDFQYLTTSSVFGFRDLDVQFPGAGPYQDEITLGSSSFGDDHDMTWNAGLLINPNGKFSAGLVYKEGGSFNVTNRLFARDFASCADAACDVDFSGEAFRSQRLNLPDILSVGIALRPSDTWLLSAQLDRIDYGNLPNGTPTGFLFGAFQGESADIDELGNETSVHLGAEKTLIFDAPCWACACCDSRGGFTDPIMTATPRRHDDTHFTFGRAPSLAKVCRSTGTEWSDRVDAVVMSAVYHLIGSIAASRKKARRCRAFFACGNADQGVQPIDHRPAK